MACISPLDGFKSKKVNPETGRRSIVFGPDGDLSRPVSVPCGQCIGCRLEYARGWAIRCMHEASLHEENCFITLTYDDDHLPAGGSLKKEHCSSFIKRLRSRLNGKRFKFYLAGEYGSVTYRPHYHALLFGVDMPDKKLWSRRKDYAVWHSDLLEQTWSHGLAEVGSATFESAAYCARYMVAKFKGPKEVMDKYYDGLEPEFALMSRGGRTGHGIAYDYYQKHGKEIVKHDSVIINGKEQKPPPYYDRFFQVEEPLKSACLKAHRKEKAIRAAAKDGRGDSRLMAEKKLMEARVKLRKESGQL